MTLGPNDLTALQLCRARGELRRAMDALLRGSKLEIRELTRALAICNPRDREQGRIYIPYATADVSLRRVTWEYFGPLQGYEATGDPDREPGVDAAKIIAALTGQTLPPAL
jgi:hypothetical protein